MCFKEISTVRICYNILSIFPFCPGFDGGVPPHCNVVVTLNSVDYRRHVVTARLASEIIIVTQKMPKCWNILRRYTHLDQNVVLYNPLLLSQTEILRQVLVYEDTLDAIEKRQPLFVTKTCPICLEKITAMAVARCGHVYCATCAERLRETNASCSLCRGSIEPLCRVGNPSNAICLNGSTYIDDKPCIEGNDTLKRLQPHVRGKTVFVTHSLVVAKDLSEKLQTLCMVGCAKLDIATLHEWEFTDANMVVTVKSIRGVCLKTASTVVFMDNVFHYREYHSLLERFQRIGRRDKLRIVLLKYTDTNIAHV
jgi:hypothetical protein